MSPARPLNSSNTMFFSTCRMRCNIACLAVCAAMRPKFCGVTSTSMSSPSWMLGLRRRASASDISSCLLTTCLDDEQLGQGANRAGLAVDFDAQIAGGADALLGRLQQGLLDGLKQGFLVDALFALQILQHRYQFAVHSSSILRRHNPFGEQKSGFFDPLFHAAKNLDENIGERLPGVKPSIRSTY